MDKEPKPFVQSKSNSAWLYKHSASYLPGNASIISQFTASFPSKSPTWKPDNCRNDKLVSLAHKARGDLCKTGAKLPSMWTRLRFIKVDTQWDWAVSSEVPLCWVARFGGQSFAHSQLEATQRCAFPAADPTKNMQDSTEKICLKHFHFSWNIRVGKCLASPTHEAIRQQKERHGQKMMPPANTQLWHTLWAKISVRLLGQFKKQHHGKVFVVAWSLFQWFRFCGGNWWKLPHICFRCQMVMCPKFQGKWNSKEKISCRKECKPESTWPKSCSPKAISSVKALRWSPLLLLWPKLNAHCTLSCLKWGWFLLSRIDKWIWKIWQMSRTDADPVKPAKFMDILKISLSSRIKI